MGVNGSPAFAHIDSKCQYLPMHHSQLETQHNLTDLIWPSFVPHSLTIVSYCSLIRNANDSRAARQMWFLLTDGDIPISNPVALSLFIGACERNNDEKVTLYRNYWNQFLVGVTELLILLYRLIVIPDLVTFSGYEGVIPDLVIFGWEKMSSFH